MVTPFRADGAVDLERFRELAAFLVDNGSDGLVVCGTTGESPTLTDEEKLDLFRAAVEAVGDRATVSPAPARTTRCHSVHLTREATRARRRRHPRRHAVLQQAAATGDRPPLRGDRRRHRPARGRLQHPGRVVVNIESTTIARLAEIENVVAVKQAHDDPAEARFIAEETRLDLYSGDDPNTFAFLELGGVGVVSVTAHLWGRQIAEMIRRHRDGRRRGSPRAPRGAAARRTTSCGSRRTRSRSRRR